MQFLLETVLFVAGLVVFFAFAFFAPSLFWIGFVIFLVFATVAFMLGYMRRRKNPEETLKEEITQL
jgi:membrane protein implicated in regulation of membrane protease activity